MKIPKHTFYYLEDDKNKFIYKDTMNNFIKYINPFCVHSYIDYDFSASGLGKGSGIFFNSDYYILGYVPEKFIIV